VPPVFQLIATGQVIAECSKVPCCAAGAPTSSAASVFDCLWASRSAHSTGGRFAVVARTAGALFTASARCY
jgi:hypothetical protein